MVISGFFPSCNLKSSWKVLSTFLEICYAISSYSKNGHLLNIFWASWNFINQHLCIQFLCWPNLSLYTDTHTRPCARTHTHTHTHTSTETQRFNSRVNYSCSLSVQSREKCSLVHLQPEEGNFPCQLTSFLPSAKGQESFSFGWWR